MSENVFEKQLDAIQRKRAKKEGKDAFRKIDNEIKKLSDAWITFIIQDMETTIELEPDLVKREAMKQGIEEFLSGFEAGYYAGWLRQRADEI